MRKLSCLLLATLVLNGCFESKGGSKSSKGSDNTNNTSPVSPTSDVDVPPGTPTVSPPVPPTEPPSTSSPAHLLDVYIAQTHVLRPEDRFFRLVSERDALFVARVENDSQVLTIEVLDRLGGMLGNLKLKGPDQLDKTAGNRPAPFTLAHSVRIPAAWINPGMQIRLLHGQQQLSIERPSVGAPNILTFNSVPVVLFSRPLDSLPAGSLAMSTKHRDEYVARLPVSRLDYRALPPLQLDRLALRPTEQSPGEFLLAWPHCQNDQPLSAGCDGYRIIEGVYDYLELLMAANGEEDIAHYYGRILDDNIFGGVGGSGLGTGHDWDGIMHHEMAHAFGLGHAGEDFQKTFDSDFNSHFPAGSKRFPYAASLPGDSSINGNVGSTWGYDLNRSEFIAPYLYAPDGTIKQHKQDATHGGGTHLEAGHIYAMLADAYVSRVQTHLEGYSNRPGKIHYDATTNQLQRWNYDQNRYDTVPYPAPCPQRPMCSGPGDLPIEHQLPVISLFGSISRTTPELTLVHAPYAHTGNLIRLYDPTQASDLQELREQYNLYCADAGCQYVLRITESVGGQLHQRHILLRAGFFDWGDWEENILKPGADDPNSEDSFIRWAVNIRPLGELEKVEVLFKNHAQNGLILGEGEVVAIWTKP